MCKPMNSSWAVLLDSTEDDLCAGKLPVMSWCHKVWAPGRSLTYTCTHATVLHLQCTQQGCINPASSHRQAWQASLTGRKIYCCGINFKPAFVQYLSLLMKDFVKCFNKTFQNSFPIWKDLLHSDCHTAWQSICKAKLVCAILVFLQPWTFSPNAPLNAPKWCIGKRAETNLCTVIFLSPPEPAVFG